MKNLIKFAIISILLISCQKYEYFTPNKYSEAISAQYKDDISINYQILIDINNFIKKSKIDKDIVLSNHDLFNLYCQESKICPEIQNNVQWNALIQPSYNRYHIHFEYLMNENTYYECTIDQNDNYPLCNTNTIIK